ncbi:MAG: hypothetical protein A4E23_00229 [Methanomethylovorans sp. PtaU1.Bin073]|nr:MAG: hypothetical protein A4E23_00229 [Methanomethylovorans sp. PtaU1.Bin073]
MTIAPLTLAAFMLVFQFPKEDSGCDSMNIMEYSEKSKSSGTVSLLEITVVLNSEDISDTAAALLRAAVLKSVPRMNRNFTSPVPVELPPVVLLSAEPLSVELPAESITSERLPYSVARYISKFSAFVSPSPVVPMLL